MELNIKIEKSIDHIPDCHWEEVVDQDDLFMSREFCRVIEKGYLKENVKIWYMVVYDRLKPVCAGVIFQMPIYFDELLDSKILKTTTLLLRRVWQNFLTAQPLVCGMPISNGQSALRISNSIIDNAEKENIIKFFVSNFEMLAKKQKTNFLVLKEFQAKNEVLKQHGYICGNSLPMSVLEIRWKTFDDYLNSMRARYRRNFYDSIRKRRQSTVITQTNTLDEHFDDKHYELYLNVLNRADFKMETLPKAFFKEIAKELPSNSHLLTMKDNDVLSGYFLICESNDTLYGMFVGIDYNLNLTFDTYINLLLEAVRLAIEKGKKRFDIGQSSYDIKARYGCLPSDLYLFIKHKNNMIQFLLKKFKKYIFPQIKIENKRVFK